MPSLSDISYQWDGTDYDAILMREWFYRNCGQHKSLNWVAGANYFLLIGPREGAVPVRKGDTIVLHPRGYL